jgi:hypothetical protein
MQAGALALDPGSLPCPSTMLLDQIWRGTFLLSAHFPRLSSTTSVIPTFGLVGPLPAPPQFAGHLYITFATRSEAPLELNASR